MRLLLIPALLLSWLLPFASLAQAFPERAPVSVFNAGIRAFRAYHPSKGNLTVPGIHAIIDFWGDDPIRTTGEGKTGVVWAHGVAGATGGYGGSGKVSSELYMAFGASYSPHELGAVGFLYEPFGWWVTPLQGIAGSGFDLRARLWRMQVEYGWRGQGVFKGFVNGDIKQQRWTVKLLPWKALLLGVEMYPSATFSGSDTQVDRGTATNFMIGVTAF
ncbi:MAG TPA: hypothetical protein VD971_03615 [Phycisphaerales bacterium]|nr:hypothetical protein [Phycisphaerales bacterium]